MLDLPVAVAFQVGDSDLVLLPAPDPQARTCNGAIAFWAVDDVDSAFQRLLQMEAVAQAPVEARGNIKTARVTDPFGNILGIIGPNPEAAKSTVEQKASETALGVTFLRALATRDPREEIRGRDYLAEKFLSGERLKAFQDPAAMKERTKKRIAPGLYEYMLARTAFFDELVEQALKQSIPQIVFLGAGYDTRPYRLKDLITGTRMFELDIHTTQQSKKELLQKGNIPIPENLVFVAVNFKTDKLPDVLLKAGFSKTRKALFIWEGVTYYLPPPIVDETMSSIRSVSAPGSTLAFDYVSRFPGMMESYGTKELYAIMKSFRAGEPADLFNIERGKIEAFLSERGYRIIEHFSAAEMERKYLTLRDGSLAGNMTGHVCFVHASVAG